MKLMLIASLFSIFGLQAFTVSTRIINGTDVTNDAHPGAYNTVALLKSATNKAFCTGSLIKQDLVVTAKHCLVGKKLEDIKIFLGDSDQRLEEGVVIDPIDFKVRYEQDWDMFFPSFDIAWIKLEKPAPFPFKALPFLNDPKKLNLGQDIHLVGFGNSSPIDGKIVAGKKLQGLTRLDEYLNNRRYFNILSFSGNKGQGTCHGDSGGPAYTQIDGQWYIIGVANGFDPVITTKSMVRTTDSEFPYKVKCSENQSLYSFVGAHQEWIESTSHESFNSLILTSQDKEISVAPNTLEKWCQNSDIGSPKWNLLRHVLNSELDKRPQEDGRELYLNCDNIIDHLKTVETIALDFDLHSPAHYDLGPLSLLPNLKKVYLNKVNLENIRFGNLSKKSFNQLSITNSDIKTISMLPVFQVLKLNLSNNPITELNGLERFKTLQSLEINRTKVSDLSLLSEVSSLVKLGITSVRSQTSLKGLELLTNLEDLNIYSSPISRTVSFKTLSRLKILRVNGSSLDGIGKLDLSQANSLTKVTISNAKDIDILWPSIASELEQVSITNSSLTHLKFLKGSSKLKKANFHSNNITDLTVFKNSFPILSYLSLNKNPIKDVSDLINIPNIKRLQLSGIMLETGEVAKTSQNCPVNGPETHPVSLFCR
jgi:hypothetical protein